MPDLEPAGAHSVGATFAPIHVNHWAVTRKGQFHLLLRDHPSPRIVSFITRNDSQPSSVFVLRGVSRVQLVNVEILLIDVEDRKTEGDSAIVTKRNSGKRWFTGPDDIEAWR